MLFEIKLFSYSLSFQSFLNMEIKEFCKAVQNSAYREVVHEPIHSNTL